MLRSITTVVCLATLTFICAIGGACAWTFVEDRLNNPDYQGVSGLSGEATTDALRIWGVNTGAPPDEFHGANLWCGLGADYGTRFSSVVAEAKGTLNGSGWGYLLGIALWQDTSRYVIYGMEYDNTNGNPYVPSRWVASGQLPSWPYPSWTALSTPLSSPNEAHSYRVEYESGIVRFLLDGQLLDEYQYAMDTPSVRLVAYARTYGDTVDASFSQIGIHGPVPEPSSLLALLCGVAGCLRLRRR